MATSQALRAAEKSLTPLRFSNTVDVDTSAITIEVWLVDPDTVNDVSPTKYKIGEGLGAAIGVDFSIECDFATTGVDVGTWLVYAAGNTANPNPVTVCPNKKTADLVYIDVYRNPII